MKFKLAMGEKSLHRWLPRDAKYLAFTFLFLEVVEHAFSI